MIYTQIPFFSDIIIYIIYTDKQKYDITLSVSLYCATADINKSFELIMLVSYFL